MDIEDFFKSKISELNWLPAYDPKIGNHAYSVSVVTHEPKEFKHRTIVFTYHNDLYHGEIVTSNTFSIYEYKMPLDNQDA